RKNAQHGLNIIDADKKNKIKQKTEDNLLNIKGMNKILADKLAKKNIFTLEDLADQGIDDLTDIEILDAKKAGLLIMAARNICWFGDKV
ncbi:MAG: helix-hairpin-helix domain-containing protein, partial [Buchnera aphidicola]|nr:helix-hairpin-helix domain-containing protein [Buchnera aphidicola]